ncbi:MAG: DUF1670 domain-containing protein [Oligoflexia bacterium]|nr:DUF1670 domain-containing protein [Oligoflexia bacterium]
MAAGLDYLRARHLGDREPLDILLEVPAGRGLRWKVAPQRAECRQVILSPCAEDDLELWLEFGLRPMQSARAVRLVEQADCAGCTLALSQLVSLVHLSSRTLSRRLAPLWKQGVRLPVLGIPDSVQGRSSRLAEVLRGRLSEQGIEPVRRRLLLSPAAYGRLLRTASRVVKGYCAGQAPLAISHCLGLSPAEVDSTLELARQADRSPAARARLAGLLDAQMPPAIEAASGAESGALSLRRAFEAHLMRQYRFSPVRAELLLEALDEAQRSRQGLDRAAGDVVFWAISDSEPAGKARVDCELVATVLPFYEPHSDRVARGSASELKVRKAVRLASEARRQGGLLCLPDLCFLLGMEVRALQRAIAGSDLFIPTRGAIMDIGRGVTHRVQIVSLYVQGHTETQIVRRTHHTYESVGAYIDDFRRVMLLCDRDLPASHIRKVLGKSLKLVNAYITLYRQLDTDEHQWKLNLMRRAAQEQEKKRRS